MAPQDIPNEAAPNLPYFTPFQKVPPGAAYDPEKAPSLFKPFKIRGVEFHNRIWVAPMCQYSADNGRFTDWHLVHLGGIITRGPSLSIIEATAVVPEGRITPQDAGLWDDSQIEPLKRIADFAHSQNARIGIQLGHAGRKASTTALWLGGGIATEAVGGWPEDVVGPSDLPYDKDNSIPKPLTKEGIENVKKAFVDAAKRAIKAGVDVIEIHGAHGYLLSSFLSPTSNKRTDDYGGSWENRTRLILEIIDLVRAAIPESTPLLLRISATDWLEHLPDVKSWTSSDTVRLARILATRGVDLLDVSSAGNDPRQKITLGPAYQADLARDVKQALQGTELEGKMLVGTVGEINEGKLAQSVLDQGKADVILAGRWFLKDTHLVWTFAEHLGVNINLANQIRFVFQGLPRLTKDKKLAAEDAKHGE